MTQKDPILHVTTTFSLKQRETRTSHGQIPHPLSEKQNKQNKTKQNKTKQNKTKQNKTKQNKTKQSKTKQNKTNKTK